MRRLWNRGRDRFPQRSYVPEPLHEGTGEGREVVEPVSRPREKGATPMAEDTRGWSVQPNPSETYDREVTVPDGEGGFTTETVTDFGRPEWAYRRPGDHFLVFSGVSADQDPPSQSATEHSEAQGWEAPLPDSTVAAEQVAERDQAQS